MRWGLHTNAWQDMAMPLWGGGRGQGWMEAWDCGAGVSVRVGEGEGKGEGEGEGEGETQREEERGFAPH